jgi:carbonic anhydrase
MTRHRIGLSDNWLRHVQDVAAKHDAELRTIADQALRHRTLCEMNVREQVQNIAACTAVQEAWERGQPLELHGWIYDLKDGVISDLQVSRSS